MRRRRRREKSLEPIGSGLDPAIMVPTVDSRPFGVIGGTLTCSPWASGVGKRATDLFVSICLSIVTLPLVVALAAGSAISYRAWPFFVQERLGRHGDPFKIVKLRSLPVRTPVDAHKYALDEFEISPWGRMIRRTHLDELPQLWQVVSGKMSLVGPRPEMPTVAALFPDDFVRARCEVRPGCTGLWQVGPHASGLIGENPHYDLYYVTSASLAIDVRVVLRTITLMLGAPPLTLAEFNQDRLPDDLSAGSRGTPVLARSGRDRYELPPPKLSDGASSLNSK